MPDNALKQIAKPTLGNLTEVGIRDFSTVFHSLEYGYRIGLDGGKLFDTSGKNRQIQISEHFTAGEFAVSRTQHYNLARIHENLVYELEKIRVFFNKAVNIVNGYMSQTPWQEKVVKLEIEENHLAGLAARIQVAGVPPLQLAKFAIILGEKSTSISVGRNDIIIAVNQKSPKIYSHIGEGSSSRRSSRVSRENAIKALQSYYDFFHDTYSVNLSPLEEHYHYLRILLIHVTPNIQRGFFPGHYKQHVREQREIILNLFQNHQLTDEFIVTLLFYSNYYTLFRAYLRLANAFANDPKKRSAFEYYAVVELGEILCPGLKAVRARRRQNFGSPVQYPRSCVNFPDEIKLPLTLYPRIAIHSCQCKEIPPPHK